MRGEGARSHTLSPVENNLRPARPDQRPGCTGIQNRLPNRGAMKKLLVLAALLLTALPSAAQPRSWTVVTADGRTVKGGADDSQMNALLAEFLKGSKDGKFTMSLAVRGQARKLELVKKGGQVEIWQNGKKVASESTANIYNSFFQARSRGQLTACKSNEKNIATGVEMWAADHKGAPPAKLAQLIPSYLRTIPTCPNCQRDSYSATYKVNGKKYSFFCNGAKGHPSYDSEQGLSP